jgi:ATP-binding cassette subfamily B protein
MKNLTKQTLLIFWQHASRYWWACILVAIGVLVGTGVDLYKPFLLKQLLDILATNDISAVDAAIGVVFSLLASQGIGWLGWRLATFADSYLNSRVMSNLLETCYAYLLDHSHDFFNNNFSGSLVRRVTRYTKSYEQITDQIFWGLGRTVLVLTTVLTVLFLRQWMLGLVVVVWGGIYLAFNYYFIKYKWHLDVTYSEVDSKTTGHIADSITNIVNVKLFGGSKVERKSFNKLTEGLYELRRKIWNYDSITESVTSAFMIALEFAIFFVAIRLWQQGALTLGDFALIQGYLLKVFDHMWDVGKKLRKIFTALSEAEEMTEILVREHDVKDAPDATELRVDKGLIEFKNVGFRYEKGKKVFNDFNFTVKPGERIALIGPSGGGKSTTVKMLFRFFDIQEGQILIDGQNIAEVTQDSLRQGLSLVPQDPILFHRTLMDNIRYARPEATDAEVVRAAKLAHCHEFIGQLPEKYETFVGERGVKLSGGERQRVAIARAILKNSPILVLDEATSSLDSESEYYIQEALKDLMQNKTTIVIAHRLSTIMQMDRIVVIEGGKILEEGTHKELLKVDDGVYQKLWGIQAGSFKR